MTLKREDFTSLVDLLDTADERDFHVNNLFQLDDGTWQCSLRSKTITDKGEHFFEYGVGEWPEQALTNALYNADAVKNLSNQAAKKRLRRPK